MKSYSAAFLAFILLAPLLFPADFATAPYLYPYEKNATVTSLSFPYGNASTAKLLKVNGEGALLLLDSKIVEEKPQMRSILSDYYVSSFYPSSGELSELSALAKAFNDSRNYKYAGWAWGVEDICTRTVGLYDRPCSDIVSCRQTAQMICINYGSSSGCDPETLAPLMVDYKKSTDKLNSGYSKFLSAYFSLTPSTVASSFSQMAEGLASMKEGADEAKLNKLGMPPAGASLVGWVGACQSPKFDDSAMNSAKAKVASLSEKAAPLAALEGTVDSLQLSTEARIKYREGEEKAAIFSPRYNAVRDKFGGLKSQAVESKLLISDSSFISLADGFLNKEDELEQRLATRDFSGFDALLSSYEYSGRSLSAAINNSTAPYHEAIGAQDEAADQLLQAQWRVNRLSPSSVDVYNSLATRKIEADSGIAPPMTSEKYYQIISKYKNLSFDARAYIAASSGAQESLFGAGNAFSRASIDGAMGIASSMAPVSFKTRQSVARYVPPLVMGAVDLFLLAVAMLIFAWAFVHFRGFFRNKIALSGWALTLIGFVFLLVVGSAGLYAMVVSTENFSSFSDFKGVLMPAPAAAIIVDESGASSSDVAAMRSCSDQIALQLDGMGKGVYRYYLVGDSCTSMIPKSSGNNTTAFETVTGLTAEDCLDSMPDMPIFHLAYGEEAAQPAFTTVVAKQALVSGNGEYYSKKPMCDIANVLG